MDGCDAFWSDLAPTNIWNEWQRTSFLPSSDHKHDTDSRYFATVGELWDWQRMLPLWTNLHSSTCVERLQSLVSRQQCERQKCERHQCKARSANANSAKRQQCEWDKCAKVKCAKVRSANATLVRSDKTPKWFKSSEAAAAFAFRMEFFSLSFSLSLSLFLSRVIR